MLPPLPPQIAKNSHRNLNKCKIHLAPQNFCILIAALCPSFKAQINLSRVKPALEGRGPYHQLLGDLVFPVSGTSAFTSVSESSSDDCALEGLSPSSVSEMDYMVAIRVLFFSSSSQEQPVLMLIEWEWP